MLQYLLDLVGRLGHWGYLIIFVAAALECAAFAGLLVPGESLVLASGFLAHQGLLNLDAVIAAAALGASIGDNIGYQLGGPWTVALVLLGYSLGASWRMAEAWIGHAGTVVAGAAILLAVLTWLGRRRARPSTQ